MTEKNDLEMTERNDSTPLYSTPLHSTLLHSTLLHSTPLYSTLLHSTPLYSTLLHPTHFTPLHYTQSHSSPLHSIPLHATPPYPTLPHSTPLHALYATPLHFPPLPSRSHVKMNSILHLSQFCFPNPRSHRRDVYFVRSTKRRDIPKLFTLRTNPSRILMPWTKTILLF